MSGGGGWNSGEWTDDTAMAIAIAEVAATGADLRSTSATDRIVLRWVEWSRGAKDVGIQTRQVLAQVDPAAPTASARAAARAVHEQTGRSGGNGSLMRTAPVALAYLDDTDALIDAATSLSTLTHHDPQAAEACDTAVRGGRDTDTVAAIAGGLLGATHGASAVPSEWRDLVHGWPGLHAADLVTFAGQITGVAPAG